MDKAKSGIKPVKISLKKFNPSKYIETSPELKNSHVMRESRTAVITIGHFSPPTISDQRLVEHLIRYASTCDAVPFVFVEHGNVTEGYISEARRLDLARNLFDAVTYSETVSGIQEAVNMLASEFDSIIVIAREGNESFVNDAIVIEYSDAAQNDGISQHFLEGNIPAFKQQLHTKLQPFANEIYEEMSGSLTEGYLTEKIRPLSYAERIKRAQTMKRYAKRIEIARERAEMRRASPEKIIERARKKALEIIRARILKNKEYAELSIPEKNALDKRLMNIPTAVIDRITRKLVPIVRKAEAERFKSRHSHHVSTSASATGHHGHVNEMFRSFVDENVIEELYDLIEAVEVSSQQHTRELIKREKRADALKHHKMMTTAKRSDLNKRASKEFASLQKREMHEAESEVINKIIAKELERKKLIAAFKGYTHDLEGLSNKTKAEIERETKNVIAKNDIKHFTHKDLIKMITELQRSNKRKKEFNVTDVTESINPEDSTPDQREWGTDSLTNIYKSETPGQIVDEQSKGLWYNIRKRREKGLRRLRPGEKGYPKTLDIEKGDDK